MLAVIMAGGTGSRLNRGEKALVQLSGKTMLTWIYDAFTGAGHEILVVTTPDTPYTSNYCRAHTIAFYASKGKGYLSDLIETIEAVEEKKAFFTVAVDLPCISSDLIRTIEDRYRSSGYDACSVWVPVYRYKELEMNAPVSYVEKIGTELACPAGINILMGDKIHEEQNELKLLLDDKRLLFNINNLEMLEHAELFFHANHSGK